MHTRVSVDCLGGSPCETMTVLSKPVPLTVNNEFLTLLNIKKSVFRNLQSGATLGIFFLILKIRRMRLKHLAKSKQYESDNNENKHDKKEHWILSKSKIFQLIKYYIRYPLYFVLFSLFFKLGMKWITSTTSSNIKEIKLINFKHRIALMSVFIGYFTQKYLDIYNWSFALFLLLRSTHGFLRGIIPKRFHPNTIVVWMCIHAYLPHVLGYLNPYVPWNFWKVLQRVKCYNYN